MSMAKDFSSMDGIIADIATATAASSGKRQQETATAEEQAARRAAGRTQGRKGCKMQRINLAFSDENMKLIQIMSKSMGITQTKFVNQVLDNWRGENQDLYDQAEKMEQAVRMLAADRLKKAGGSDD